MHDAKDTQMNIGINLGVTGSIIALLAIIGGAQIIRWVEQGLFKIQESKGKEKS